MKPVWKWPAIVWLVALGAIGSMASSRSAPDASSPALASELMSLMQAKALQSFAARMPDQGDQFGAALAFPDVQLLVVTARHPSPDRLAAEVAQKQFSDVYSELQSGTTKESRTFFQDLGADGLATGGGIDVMYERGVQTVFDGNWKRAKLSREEYGTRLAAADKRYGELLDVLIAALKSS